MIGMLKLSLWLQKSRLRFLVWLTLASQMSEVPSGGRAHIRMGVIQQWTHMGRHLGVESGWVKFV